MCVALRSLGLSVVVVADNDDEDDEDDDDDDDYTISWKASKVPFPSDASKILNFHWMLLKFK
jgi:hypothetical protein